ncbi:Histidine phosphatase superfamily clade-2 [Penicillium vulpinum]|uniref:Histidine phosphatase superfamily clade-2 n=1 Tax=Penicillium vulpinum TaxID=29845 RepID=UPI002546816F|nr:Histidine phosphatase superfamily clade-2 [Penicillium vulpinum]KAJ5950981.1 Histidine phosphatase superfamily clade-2 [Penicillium vulpinum]
MATRTPRVGSKTPRAPVVRLQLVRLRWSFILFIVLGLLAIISSEIYIFEGIRQTWYSSLKPISVMRSIIFLSVAASVLGKSVPADTFYPPSVNDTSYITDSSIGTYGATYEAPTKGPTSGTPYGAYHYCAMPHPRSKEYELPEALTKGSTKGKIVYLEYLQRHQRRTPYNIFPGGEDQEYRCENVRPYLYAGANSNSGVQPIEMYQQTYEDPTNPFSPGVSGTCQYPQMTIGGIQDGYQHGKDLWSVYGKKLGLIPKKPSKRVWFRSSDSALTQASAGVVLRGMWPKYKGALPLHQMVSSVNTVNSGYSCPAVGATLSSIKTTEHWNEHLAVTEELRSKLGAMFGATDNAWQGTFDHFADNFQGRLCNGYRLPCNVSDSSDCATMEMAEQVFRAGDWEWNYYWRNNPEVVKYIQAVKGLFISEIIGRLQAVVDGKSSIDYSHIFIHDGDIGPMLGALGIDTLRWPGMASNIAFEIWETQDRKGKHGKYEKSYYARVLYSGHPIRTIHGVLDWVPVSQLIDILKVYVPEDIKTLCG